MHMTDATVTPTRALLGPDTGARPRTIDRPERRTTVNEYARLRLLLAQQYRERDLSDAANARSARFEHAAADLAIRARIGRSIIRIGERLAAESNLEPARPR
jgi:hypothetical protein